MGIHLKGEQMTNSDITKTWVVCNPATPKLRAVKATTPREAAIEFFYRMVTKQRRKLFMGDTHLISINHGEYTYQCEISHKDMSSVIEKITVKEKP